jgi:hypothetical protein
VINPKPALLADADSTPENTITFLLQPPHTTQQAHASEMFFQVRQTSTEQTSSTTGRRCSVVVRFGTGKDRPHHQQDVGWSMPEGQAGDKQHEDDMPTARAKLSQSPNPHSKTVL